ncbi:hypothetical protein C8R47DRAFT_1229459 [Mycena vitilis]|nr:hypothetical protein C8R47DRAFT_1229459 [Mycena vitilis]
MSLSRVRPGASKDNPLVLDAQGYLNQVQQSPPPAPRCKSNHASLIRQDIPRMRTRAARDTASAMVRRSTTPRASTSNIPPPSPQSPGFVITGHQPASPEFVITGHRPAPPVIPSAPPVTPLRSVERSLRMIRNLFGKRDPRNPPLTSDGLWLSAARPTEYEALEEFHVCAICRSVKAHPVSLAHSSHTL